VNRSSPDNTADYRFTLPCAAITCALMPLYILRWHYGPLPTTLLETGILITILSFVVESARQRLVPDWRTPYTLPTLLFIAAGLIGVVVAPDRRAALGLYRAYILEPIAFFAVVSFVVRSWRQARIVLAGVAVAGVIVCVPNAFVVLQAIRHHTLNLAVTPPVVIYQTSNAVALFVNPLIAVAAALAVYARDRRERWVAAAFLVLAVPTSLLSFSRGGYLALAAMALALAISHPRRAWLVPVTLLAAAAVSRVPQVASRLGHEINLADPNNTLVARFRLWGATLRMLRDHPIFGTGLSGFRTSIGPYRNGVFVEDLIYPHNIVLNFWTETGLLGVAGFAWLLIQAARVALAGWRISALGWRPLQLGVVLALVGIVVHGLVDVPYWKNDLSLEFWVLLALSWAGRHWALAAPN
jgi:putative inorganic carbon (HCO3(-)) transporter